MAVNVNTRVKFLAEKLIYSHFQPFLLNFETQSILYKK